MPGDHYLQLQEVFNASHLQCMVAPIPGEVPVWVLEIYTGVLVFDPIKGGNAVRHDRLYSIVPLASKSNGVEVQNYGRQLEEVTVMAAPASIGGNPETVGLLHE